MKKIIFAVLFFLPAFCFGAFEQQFWQFYKEISPASGDITKFVLDSDVFASANENMSDLRIISHKGREVPYKLSVSRDTEATAFVPVKITNNSYAEDKTASAVIETEAGSVVNRLHVITDSENFQRTAKVYGSTDGKNWSVILDNGYVYDYTDQKGGFHSQGTELSFPDSTFRYLKVEIVGDISGSIKITGIEVAKFTKEAAREVERTPVFSVSENKAKRESSIIIDLGQRGIPVNKIVLDSTPDYGVVYDNYNRVVTIYSGNAKDSWTYVGNDYVYRYRTSFISSEKLTLQFPETTDRYLKVVVQNKDDVPVHFTSVKTFATYREILFQSVTGETYKLYYGSKNAKAPEYDFETYLQYLDVSKAQTVTLGAEKKNDTFGVVPAPVIPKSEKNPYLLPVGLGISAIILLLLIWRFLKK